MASQPDNSVSPEIGKLLELLNAFEEQDSQSAENFAALERLLVAGKGGAEDLVNAEVDQMAVSPLEIQQIDEDVWPAEAEEQAADDEHIAEPGAFETPEPAIDLENRFAAHIVHGMWKTKRD